MFTAVNVPCVAAFCLDKPRESTNPCVGARSYDNMFKKEKQDITVDNEDLNDSLS